jgi:hypothetical protein
MSLFDNLSGRSGEDISTEVLAHFLSSEDRFVPFQKLFFNRVLNNPLSSTQLHIETQTQAAFEVGRPDMIVLAGENIIVLENKLGSYLSGDDQLLAYCEVFEDNSYLRSHFPLIDFGTVKNRHLVFLAPNRIIELSRSASDKACRNQKEISFEHFLREKNITFLTLPWEELLGYLDLANSLQFELYLFVRNYLNQELTQEEKDMLQNPQVPSGIIKLFKSVDDIKNTVSAKGWNVGRTSQSYLYYGFYIEAKKTKLFFGYFLPLWENYRTPIFLQVRKEFIKPENSANFEKLLKDSAFVYDKEHEFIRRFKIDSIESWKDELINILQAIVDK